MMRPATCLSLLAALGAGLYLYQEKHTAQLLDRDITRTVKQAEAARDRIGVLRAEWSWLNDPDRLRGLANQHLQLQSTQLVQFARLEDLPTRLPAPSDTPVNAAPVPDAAPPADLARGAAPVPPSGPLAASRPQAATAAAAIRPAAKPVVLAAAVAAPKPAAPRLAAAKPREAEPAAAAAFYAPVMPAYAPAPVAVHAPTVQTASAVQPQPQPAPYIGSALGMARSGLAAPVPVASAASLGYASAR